MISVGQRVGLAVYDNRLPAVVEAVEEVDGRVVVRLAMEES